MGRSALFQFISLGIEESDAAVGEDDEIISSAIYLTIRKYSYYTLISKLG